MSDFAQQYTTKSGDKFKIEYSEHGNQWKTEVEDEYISAPSLKELKDKLERKTAPKAKSRKVPVLVQVNYGVTLQPAVATSMFEGGHYVRITLEKGGKREQLQRNRVFADTPANRKRMAEIGALSEQESDLTQKIRDLVGNLTPVDRKLLED